jgi:hypothetical protein
MRKKPTLGNENDFKVNVTAGILKITRTVNNVRGRNEQKHLAG